MLTSIFSGLNPTIVLLLFAAITVLSYIRLSRTSPPKGTRFAPGPPGKPFIGNIQDAPPSRRWQHFKSLSDQYGPVMRLRLGGDEHIVLSTEKAANDLLRERGAIYSSRQQLPAVAQLLSKNLRPLFLPYNDLWRNGRKFMHHVTNTNVANTYQPNQSVESLRMLRDLIRDPARYEHWFNRYSAGIIYRLAYGKAVFTGEEQVVQDIEGIVSRLAKVARPGAYLVDRFPILMRLPAAIAPFKRELEGLHQRELKIFRQLMTDVRAEMERGEAAKSWERDMIEQQAKFHLSDDEGAYLVGTLFEAGAGTTSVAMQTWLLCVVHHPEWFRKMQEEVDAVCGGVSRLPTLEDMPQLPVTRAVLKEAMRWQPVFPGGVPHVSVKDDTYEGMFIPAGTIVHASNWAIHYDAQLYPDPEHFRPERWLDPKFPTYREPLTTHPNLHNYSSFGFGRRICPGQNIAERSLDLLTARVAWSCDIARARDEGGKEVLPALDRFTDDLVSRPLEFPFQLKAREQARVDLIEAEHKRGEENDPIKVFE